MRKKKLTDEQARDQESTQQADKQDQEDEFDQLVLATFGNTIVTSFFNILADPHNPQNVTNQVGNMFNGVMNIALHAFKTQELTVDSTEQDLADYISKVRMNLARSLYKNPKIKALLEKDNSLDA